jgi:polyisoprenyl-teichoic acid--peptidoglycan teichoic acid transferase
VKLRRTWAQRLNLTLSVIIIAGMAAAGVLLLLVDGQTAGVQRISISGRGQLAEVTQPALEPITLLIVGVDNASGLTDGDSVLVGRDPTSMLTDTILLVRIDPQTGVVNAMSVPRDLWVTIAGSSTQAKINSAMVLGGPSALVGTLKETLGVNVNHFIQVNFSGFRNAVDALGGVPLVFDAPARDLNSGLAIEEPGCWKLDGQQALSFVRSRYYEAKQDGVWLQDPLSDRSRVQRQQVFVRAAVSQAIRQGARNPLQLRLLFEAMKNDIVLDDTLSIDRLLGIAERLRDASAESIMFYTIPVEDGWAGSAAVAYLLPDAADTVAAFNDTTERPLPVQAPLPDGEAQDPFTGPAPTTPPNRDASLFVPLVPTIETCV